ncbi:MAG: sugar transferase [Thermoleophilaceae bacterium]|jgi:exopolysaccharide biosynthesis polyprenyl glycosylphosphotransferase
MKESLDYISLAPAQTGSRRSASAALQAEFSKARSHGEERWSVLRRLLLGADIIAALVGGMVAATVGGMDLQALYLFTGAVALGWPAVTFVCGLYTAEDLSSWASGIGDTPRLLFATLAASWPLLAIASLLGAEHAAAAAIVAALATAALSVPTRGLARGFAHSSEPLRQRTVIVGSGVVAGQVVEKLERHSEFGLTPIGIVDDDVHDLGHPDLPTLGGLEDLPDVLEDHAVDRVLIAFSRASHEELLRVVRSCRDRSVAVDVVPRLFEFLEGARALDQLGGMPLLSIGAHRLSPSSHFAKRVLDVAVSGVGLLLLAPLFAVIALAIKLESRGPVFFRQVRAGREAKTFKLVKFRSMYADAEKRKAEFVAENQATDGVMFKIHSDPRITRVGSHLRRLSLDELPQLWNVLCGEMSLVGPRPLILPESNALDQSWQVRRLDLRPGLTGPWQVTGRSEVPFQEMIRFDYQYVAGWSLARDVEILMATVPAVLSGRGAY